MKNTIKKILERADFIRKSSFYYHIQRYRQYRPLKIDRSLTNRPDIIDQLEKDGICILEDFINKEACQKIIDELAPSAQEVTALKRTENITTLQLDKGAFRIGNADQFSQTAKELFFENPLIINTAKAFVSKSAVSYRREADYRTGEGKLLQADLPHFDDWRHRFKAFLYLTDVTEENAPFVYYKGSHEQAPWKLKYHLEYERDGEGGRYGHFFLQEMRHLQKKYGYEEMICTAKAGTLIFADFRGIHRGTTLKSGHRILLNNTFGITLNGIL